MLYVCTHHVSTWYFGKLSMKSENDGRPCVICVHAPYLGMVQDVSIVTSSDSKCTGKNLGNDEATKQNHVDGII